MHHRRGRRHGVTAATTGRDALVSDVLLALTATDDLHAMLQECAEAVVGHLGAAFARVWVIDEGGDLVLRASAGMYTHLDGAHSRIRVGQFKIGRIAEQQLPHLTNNVTTDPLVSDREWASREGMTSFAGYPLTVGGRIVGVIAMFARRVLGPETLEALAAVADSMALAVDRARAHEALGRSEAHGRMLLEQAGALADLGSFTVDLREGQLTASQHLTELWDINPSAGLSDLRQLVSLTHPADRARVFETVRDAFQRQDAIVEVEHRLTLPDDLRWLRQRMFVTYDRDGTPATVVGVAQDITGTKRTQEALEQRVAQLQLLAGLVTVAHEATTLRAALEHAVSAICSARSWRVGHAYISDPTNGVLHPSGIWCSADDDRFRTFRSATEAMTLPLGMGLPGRAAADRSPVWVVDMANDDGVVLRRELAVQIGLRTAVAVPVIVDDRPVAVLEFFSEVRQERDEDLLDVLALVASHLGLVVERERVRDALDASRQRFRTLVDHATDIVLVIGADGALRYSSPSFERSFRNGDAAPQDIEGLVHPDDRADLERALDRLRERSGATAVVSFRARAARGTWRQLEGVGTNLLDEPAAGGFVLELRDDTERRRVEDHLAREQEFLRAMLEHLDDGVIACDADGTPTLVNRKLRSTFARDAHENAVQVHARVFGGFDGASPLDRALRGEVVRDLDISARDPRGNSHHFIVNAQAVVGPSGDLGAVAVLHEVTAQREAEDQMRRHELHDPLTGLANRTLLAARLDLSLATPDSAVAVLHVDVDRLRDVNDNLGQAAGDQLLRTLARRIAATADNGLVARVGGDAFAVVLEDVVDDDDAVACATRIIDAVAEPLELQGEMTTVSACVGIVVARDAGAPEALLRDAETATRRAKERGTSSFELFSSHLRTATLERIEGRKALKRALAQNELRVLYQPKVSLAAGLVSGVEALLRWEQPGRGLITPDYFIPLAEESGLIVSMGSWVLDAIGRQSQEWALAFPDRPALDIAVNVSGRQFQPELVDTVRQVLEESHIDPQSLFLEVTESVVMNDVDATIQTLTGLKDLGVRISIDDFGTGYSSLAYLKRFPLDELKIDRSFVSGLGHDPEDTAIVAAVMAVANALDLMVVAEGVETVEQLDRLRGLGCEFAQGFLFARPSTASDLSEMIADGPVVGRDARARVGGTRVLIVDDAPEVRQLARVSLTTAGFVVQQAATAADAIALATEWQPDCVVLDVQLPDGSGFDVCRALRANPATSDATILMLTSQAEGADKVTAFAAGADDYIVKPFSPRDLASRVGANIRRRWGLG